MAAVIPNALAKFIGLFYIRDNAVGGAWKRVGSVRGLLSKCTYENTEIKADDTGIVVNFVKPVCTVECTFLETGDTDLMDIIFPGTASSVAGTPVSVTGEDLGTGWTVGNPIKLTNKNGAGTVVTSIVVYEAASPLVLNTNYAVYVSDGTDGDSGYTYIAPLTAASGAITADYDYTPNASKSFTFNKTQLTMPTLDAKIEATDDSGKIRRITLTDCKFSGDYNQDFLDAVEAGDLNGSSFTIDLNDGGTFLYYDEINV